MQSMMTLALFDIGGPEMMLILVVVLMLFGAKRLPEMARNFGRSMEEFKKAARNVREEVMNADLESNSRPAISAPVEPPASVDTVTTAETIDPVSPEAGPQPVESKAEVTLEVSSTPPVGTVSQSEVQDDQAPKTV